MVTLELNGKSIEIDNQNINKFFRPNSFSEKTLTGYSRKVIEGKYDPFLVSTAELNNKIEMEV